jgi:hypothetical protein
MNMLDDHGLPIPDYCRDGPIKGECRGSYADPNADFTHVSYEWSHSLIDVLNAITDAGLRIEFIHEFPFSVYGDRPFLVRGHDGLWRHKNENVRFPLLFSIKAIKH